MALNNSERRGRASSRAASKLSGAREWSRKISLNLESRSLICCVTTAVYSFNLASLGARRQPAATVTLAQSGRTRSDTGEDGKRSAGALRRISGYREIF